MKKAYLDANILLAISAGQKKEPDQYRLALEIFNEIRDGKIVGVISSLTLMEVLAVLRTQKGREKEKILAMPRDKQLEFVLKESKSMYDKLMQELLKLSNIKFDLGRHTDMNKLMDNAFDLMQNIKGKIRLYRRCSRCGSTNVSYTAFKGLGSDDIIHALLAKDVGCDQVITFDKDFEDLKNLEEFDNVMFRVLRW